MVADGDQDLRHLNETAARLQAANTDASLLVEVSRRWRGLYFVATATETMGVYGDNDLKRTIIAMIGLGANQPEDATWPTGRHHASLCARARSAGRALHASSL